MTRWEDWDREFGRLSSPATDYSEWPGGYSILLNEKIMHPEDMALTKMKIDRKRQLFVDDYLIAHSTGIEKEFHAVKKHPSNPMFENCWPLYFAEDENGLRMYSKRFRGDGISLSLSNDGIRWENPELNVVDTSAEPESHSGPNNLVQPVGQPSGLFFDPDCDDPSNRWKMILGQHKRQKRVEWPYLRRQDGFYRSGEFVPLRKGPYVRQEEPLENYSAYELHTSEDGISWKYKADTSLNKLQSHMFTPLDRPRGIGDCLVTRWDPYLKKYIAHGKCFIGPDFRFPPSNEARAMLWSESDDLIHWSNPRVYAYPDMKDAQTFGMYGIYEADGWPYESMWLGCFSMTAYFPWPNSDWIVKRNWVVLAGSRDGNSWYYLGDRDPFIPNGEGDAWDAHYIRMANLSTVCGPLVKDDELFFYYHGSYGGTTEFPGKERSDKSRWVHSGGLGTLRRDGFASLNASEKPGVVFTRPLVFEGQGELFVNAEVEKGGFVRVAVVDEGARELPGFEESSCRGVMEDSTCSRVVWETAETLGSLKGRYVRLAFHVKSAKLYSFWVE